MPGDSLRIRSGLRHAILHGVLFACCACAVAAGDAFLIHPQHDGIRFHRGMDRYVRFAYCSFLIGAGAGWATYAPRGNWSFAGTALLLFVALYPFWWFAAGILPPPKADFSRSGFMHYREVFAFAVFTVVAASFITARRVRREKRQGETKSTDNESEFLRIR